MMGKSRKKRAFPRILSTEGSGLRLCWAFSKPKGPHGAGLFETKQNISGTGKIRAEYFRRMLYTEARGVRLCWAVSQTQGLTPDFYVFEH